MVEGHGRVNTKAVAELIERKLGFSFRIIFEEEEVLVYCTTPNPIENGWHGRQARALCERETTETCR